ncbi:MAG TPA: RHS repeat-associated core domain-containing protein, partial [Pirellula sp.]|nr:RHS repeat-associated core domain-containing protein [Pirellula sp.]
MLNKANTFTPFSLSWSDPEFSKEYDDKARLYYYGFRFYDPNFQRFINADPLGEEGGINLYELVGNDPINSIDPFGLDVYEIRRPAHKCGGMFD